MHFILDFFLDRYCLIVWPIACPILRILGELSKLQLVWMSPGQCSALQCTALSPGQASAWDIKQLLEKISNNLQPQIMFLNLPYFGPAWRMWTNIFTNNQWLLTHRYEDIKTHFWILWVHPGRTICEYVGGETLVILFCFLSATIWVSFSNDQDFNNPGLLSLIRF